MLYWLRLDRMSLECCAPGLSSSQPESTGVKKEVTILGDLLHKISESVVMFNVP